MTGLTAEVAQHRNELVATQPCHGVAVAAHDVTQPQPCLPQHVIARRVALGVVDGFETV